MRRYSAPTDSSIPSAKLKFIPTSGTYPQGFSVSGTYVGVKPSNKKHPDLALFASDPPANAAAVFTTNKFQAAPVQVSREILQQRGGAGISGIIINAGCANAVTGKGGLEDARAMSETASSRLNRSAADRKELSTLVMSTGVIGQRLPIQKILDAVPTAHSNLSSTHDAYLATAKSICTTDTFPKLLSTSFTLPSSAHANTTYRLAGMTKGAGMIHPNMATLLGVLLTDCPVAPSALQQLLKTAMTTSFNAISIDGDTSTNDTVAILANGAAAPSPSTPPISSASDPDYSFLLTTLTDFTRQLAQLVVRDGEGATKFVEVRIRNAPSVPIAQAIAATISRSPLVKTALYGRDANWGRILCAVGYTPNVPDGSIDPSTISVSFVPSETSGSKGEGVLRLCVRGEPESVDEARAARLLEDEDLILDVDLGTGTEEGRYWFCDLSHEYVTINGDYRT